MRLIIISCTSLLTVVTGLAPVYAEPLNSEQLYELCSKSSQNAQCQGYQAPIALDARPGEAGACVITIKKIENRTVCKLALNNDTVTTYYEVGEDLDVLSSKKATREIQIRPTTIKTIHYQEGTKDNSTARVLNTLLFGLGGLFGSRNKKVSEIAIDYVIPAAADATPATAPKAEPSAPATVSTGQQTETTDRVSVVVRRKTGEDLRLQLEKLTGLKAETPRVEKQPEVETKPSEQNAD